MVFCLQNYNFSVNPQGGCWFFSFYCGSSRHFIPTLACAGAWDLCLRLAFYVPFPLMGKEPKDQGQNHRPCTRPPKRLTFKSGSAFGECKRKRPSLKVKRLAIPCGRFPARRPGLPAHPSWVLAFPHTVSVVIAFVPNDTLPPLESLRT